MREETTGRWRALAGRMVPTYWGWAVVAVLCYLAGFALAGLAMAMVWEFGESLGITPWQQKLYGAGHAAIHIVAILTCFCIGGYLMEKRKGRAFIAMLIVMVAGGYGTTNIAGFAAKNRVAVSDAVDVNNAREMAAYEAQRADLQNRRNWAENIVVNVHDYSPADRLQAKKRVNEYQKQLDALRPPTVTASTVTGDASMSVYARLTGWASNSLQAGAVVWFAVLMFIGEVYILVQGTDRAARAWARTSEPLNQRTNEPSEPKKGGSDGSGGGEPRKKPDLKSVPKPEPAGVRAEPSKQRRSWSYVPATGAPERNLSAFDRAYEVATRHPYLSTRAIAARAGVSQSTGHRGKVKALTKADRIVRKFGNGEGFRPLAYN